MTLRFYLILIRKLKIKMQVMFQADKNMEKVKFFSFSNVTGNFCRHFGNQYYGFSKKMAIVFPYDPAVQFHDVPS